MLEELVVQLIAESMGLTVGPDIDKCHRYGRTGNSRPRPVIIRFTKIATGIWSYRMQKDSGKVTAPEMCK